MITLHKRRLLKLAAHLEKQKLGHEKFNFAVWNADKDDEQLDRNGCGYSGCAIGECPFVFPKDWTFKAGRPRTKKVPPVKGWSGRDWPWDSAMHWFGITTPEMQHLFISSTYVISQQPERYGGRILRDTATPKQVARNIRIFVARKEKAK